MIAQQTEHTTQGQQTAAPGPSNPAAEQKAVSPRAQSTPIPVGNRGLDLATFDDVWKFSATVAQSGLAPKGLTTPHALFAAIVYGMELGIPAMTAICNTAVINGRPSLYGEIVLGIVRDSGQLERIEEWWELGGKRVERVPAVLDDSLAAVCEIKRLGCKAVVSTFSVAQAKRAGLWGKEGPWSQYPERMMKNRARSFAIRDEFGDVLKGVRTEDEARDIVNIDPKDVTVETVNPPAPAEAVAATRAREVRIEQAKAATIENARPAKPRQPIAPGPVTMTAARNAEAAKPPIDVQASVEPAPFTAPADPQPPAQSSELFTDPAAEQQKPADGKVSGPQQMLAHIMTTNSFTFEDCILGVKSSNLVAVDDGWKFFNDIPDATARLLVNSRQGLLNLIKKAKEARAAKAAATSPAQA